MLASKFFSAGTPPIQKCLRSLSLCRLPLHLKYLPLAGIGWLRPTKPWPVNAQFSRDEQMRGLVRQKSIWATRKWGCKNKGKALRGQECGTFLEIYVPVWDAQIWNFVKGGLLWRQVCHCCRWNRKQLTKGSLEMSGSWNWFSRSTDPTPRWSESRRKVSNFLGR